MLKAGEVVILKTEQSRSLWPLAKIIPVHPDRKRVVRIVKVLSNGQTSLRTVKKLVPLELAHVPSCFSSFATMERCGCRRTHNLKYHSMNSLAPKLWKIPCTVTIRAPVFMRPNWTWPQGVCNNSILFCSWINITGYLFGFK